MTLQPYTEPVSRLLPLGRPMGEWPDYPTLFGLTSADVPELLRMAQDDDLRFMEKPEGTSDDDELPEWYAGVYAWRTLAQLKAEEAIPVMLDVLRKGELDDDHEDDWLASEAPTLFCLIGPVVIPYLADVLTNAADPTYLRCSAVEAFEKIAAEYPETRDACITPVLTALRDHAHNDKTVNGFLISGLVELGAGVENIDLIEIVFATKNVDVFVDGDLEEVKINLGLLKERITPRPMPLQFLHKDPLLSIRSAAKVKAIPKKEKNKRKQEKKSRKKNRKK